MRERYILRERQRKKNSFYFASVTALAQEYSQQVIVRTLNIAQGLMRAPETRAANRYAYNASLGGVNSNTVVTPLDLATEPANFVPVTSSGSGERPISPRYHSKSMFVRRKSRAKQEASYTHVRKVGLGISDQNLSAWAHGG